MLQQLQSSVLGLVLENHLWSLLAFNLPNFVTRCYQIYSASSIDVSITNIPMPAPKYVGQSVPDCGKVGAGVPAAAFAAATSLHLQSLLLVHDGFLQAPA